MKWTMWHEAAVLSCLLFFLAWPSPAESVQWNCATCKGITDRFAEKYAETEKGGFGGGNTDWEETYLKEYRRSEVRLLEIIEQLCTKDNHACHALVEEHEELLEEWWRKDESPHTNLYKWLCIDHVKACCPNNTWGPSCRDCPVGREKVCSGRGKCDGDGTREGTGACSCDKGYQGALCEQCTVDHYEEYKNTTHVSCKECNEACDECYGPEANECKKCRDNHVLVEGSCEECDPLCKGCTGVGPENCVKCDVGKGADMVEGYCIECARPCHGCNGPGPENCKRCRMGYKQNKEGICEDVDECQSMCRLQHEVCTNTMGGYDCECEEGYKKNPRGDCVMLLKDEVASEVKKVNMFEKYMKPNKHPKKMLTGSTQEALRLVSIFFIVVLALVVAMVEPVLGAFVAVVGGVVWYFVLKTY
ncbi:protein disulfide isomerase Creld2-like [Branchiostoma lanceolatum]|uniref:protein disulfide isomerase Creld2-like n=1 Tax=Branchiostoma lanceolatum TaxID=7740 RepID=UPI0034540796